MSGQWIEVEAGSLEEARELLKSQVPEGLYLISERVISEGSVQTVKVHADSVEAAFAEARSEVPEGAKIVKETKHADPKREGFTVKAADEESARAVATSQVSSRYGKEATVENLRLVAEGKKGFLGIGRKPNQYEVMVFQPALVEISYQDRVRIAGQVDSLEAYLVSWAEKEDVSSEEAVEAFAHIGPPLVDPLIRTLQHETPAVRGSAARVLGEIGDERAVMPLIASLLQDENWGVRENAALSLGKIGDPRALEPLRTVFEKDENEDVRGGAALALTDLGDTRGLQWFVDQLKTEQGADLAFRALKRIGAPAVEPLCALLYDQDKVVFQHTVTLLAQIGDRRALRPLINVLKSRNRWRAVYASFALGALTGLGLEFKENAERWLEWWQREEAHKPYNQKYVAG